jgi:hypothetical protein
MKNAEKQYRYPGTRAFTEDDHLFYGRETDKEQLHRQIKLEKLIVVFGKSGLGKSSLLNAGIVPLLKEKNNFFAIPLILGFARAENVSPSVFFLSKVSQFVDYTNFLWIKIAGDYKRLWTNATLDESFWLAFKSIQLQKPEQPIIIILDQFEEIFTANDSDINRFSFLLSTLLHGQIPQSIKDVVIEKLKSDKSSFTDDEITRLFEPIEIKFVFAIRSDKMSLLNRLKNHIPQILQKTYELQPLTIDQARDALLKPSQAKGNYLSPVFNYEKQAEEKIIDYLSSNKAKPIETFQLQLICQFCEYLIIKSSSLSGAETSEFLIQETDLGNLATIFTRHYDNLINEIPDVYRLSVRELIEENMIIDGNRVPLPDKVIASKHHIAPEILQKLVSSRLLRCEPNTTGGFSYEISHDTLVDAIKNSRSSLYSDCDFDELFRFIEDNSCAVFMGKKFIFNEKMSFVEYLFQSIKHSKNVQIVNNLFSFNTMIDEMFFHYEILRITKDVEPNMLYNNIVQFIDPNLVISFSSDDLLLKTYVNNHKQFKLLINMDIRESIENTEGPFLFYPFGCLKDPLSLSLTSDEYIDVISKLTNIVYNEFYINSLNHTKCILLFDMDFDDIYLPILMKILLKDMDFVIYSVNTSKISYERGSFYKTNFDIRFIDYTTEKFLEVLMTNKNQNSNAQS